MLVSIIQIYPLKVPVGSGCHQILGWDGNKWNRYTRTGKTWEYALPAGKVHKHQKLIFWFQTLCTYVSHILYSVRCNNFRRMSKRPIFSPRLEFSWWAVEAMVTRIVVGEQGFVIIVFCCWWFYLLLFFLLILLSLLFLHKWNRVVYLSGCCYLLGIVFVVAVQGFGFPRWS